MSRGSGNPGNWDGLAELGALNTWLERARQAPPLPEALPAPPPLPARPTPDADAAHLVALLAEGATPMLLNGRLFLLGRVTPTAQELLDEHGPAIARLLAAFATGKADRRALAAKLADVAAWRWPGTADAPARWPGREAFLLGVELVRCRECKRWDGRYCARYGRLAAPERLTRCLWALPRKAKPQ